MSAPTAPSGPHVVVVGGGIAGLAAALEVLDARRDARVTVLEAGDRFGGKLRLEEVGGYPVDVGAESLLAVRPEAVELAERVGAGDEIVTPETTSATVWSRGVLRPLPRATLMGVPTDPESARGILTDEEVERVRQERPWSGGALTEDVSVGEYVGARLGRAVVDRLVEPLLGGVYAGHADRLSLEATIPALWARAVAGESLVHGRTPAAPAPPPPGGGGSARPVFAGLRGGVGRLPELVADAARARGVVLRTRAVVRALERTVDGWRVVLGPVPEPEVVDADAVVLAVPPAPAARLLGPHAPVAAERLAGVETASTAVVTLAVERSGLGELPGSGFLVPPVEERTIKASTFSAAKWAWTGALSDELVHLRTSVGRAREEAVLQRDDADIVAVSVEEVGLALGRPLPRLVDAHVQRWGGGLPQYAVGHLSRIRDVLDDVARVPGLEVSGAAYEGVGVPAVVASAVRAARAANDHLSRIPTPRGDHA